MCCLDPDRRVSSSQTAIVLFRIGRHLLDACTLNLDGGHLFSIFALAYSLFMDIYFIIFFPSDFPKRDEMIMSLLVLEYVKSIPRYYSAGM